MADFNLYRVDGNWYARILKPNADEIVNASTGASSSSTTWADSVLSLTFGDVLGGYPVNIPSGLSPGEYDIIFYNADPASASNADAPSLGKRFKWNGIHTYSFQQKLFDM